MYFIRIILTCLVIQCVCAQRNLKKWRFPYRKIKDRLIVQRQKSIVRVCYDEVGCFELLHARSPLQKIPEGPKVLQTKFFLYRRDISFSDPQIIYYEDKGFSLQKSKFNVSQPLKVVVHGFMSKWNEKGNLIAADTYLKLDNYNVILMDWVKGARGPNYGTAAANTEVAGRQLGILLYEMIKRGLNPHNIHLVGFSLGAHVAGCASEYLKNKGLLIGRITGLDAASPLFRHGSFKEKYKKLDKEDAHFVDVLHTDSSPAVVDGFGLWEPIGHVDFFPNGGQDQPGCVDKKPSILISQFEGTLTIDMACSHIRAFHIFLESLNNKLKNTGCQFTSYKCPGGVQSFQSGECFPYIDKISGINENYRNDLGVFGDDTKGSGVMYFSTRDSNPFCGTQLKVSMQVLPKNTPLEGFINLKLNNNNHSTTFQMKCDIHGNSNSMQLLQGLSTAEYNSIKPSLSQLTGELQFTSQNATEDTSDTGNVIYINKVLVRDMYGNSWHTCGQSKIRKSRVGLEILPLTVTLYKKKC